MQRPVTPLDLDLSNPLPPRRFAMISTFPPTECGIATFAAALSAGLIASGNTVDVVRLGPSPAVEDASVVGDITPNGPECFAPAVALMNQSDVAVVQHEYGIYPGPDGSGVLDLVEHLVVPTIVIAHTVREHPTSSQRSILERVCEAADAVVVMTAAARDRLLDGYDVDARKITMIAHGASTPVGQPPTQRPSHRAPRLLTWGLLGPGKGIEWAIDAVASLVDLTPAPRYVIAGATHPKVVERAGEAYRDMLVQRAAASAAAPWISFDPQYRDLASLNELIQSADLVVLPYDSADQVTSGVLVDAVASGLPVVSTSFPHAVELLASGAGIVVPQRDPVALATAIRSVLTNPELAAAMAAEARRLSPDLSWNAVADQYATLGGQLVAGVSL